MESHLSGVSSLKEDAEPYFQPHYKESYRLAIYALLCGGTEAYEEFLKAEQIRHFLSDEEILFVLENAELPLTASRVAEDQGSGAANASKATTRVAEEGGSAAHASTYFPNESDEQVPDLELGWPEVTAPVTETSISLLFHPPRQNTPTIKEVLRRQIQDAQQVVAIAMDVFTDVDVFQEVVAAAARGVAVYILLDASHFTSFSCMAQRLGVRLQDRQNIRVRTVAGQQYHCQSGAKFSGGLEQKFILVDCRTVLYGTYSYTWCFEKMNLSMVLVVTGQLVGSYDEEFRRLYARSAAPAAPASTPGVGVRPPCSPASSQLSLHRPGPIQVHRRPGTPRGGRGGAREDAFADGRTLTRGLSMQDRLNQAYRLEAGDLVRGHSYAGELQRLNSASRLRVGAGGDVGPAAPERNCTSPWAGEGRPRTGRVSLLLSRHRLRYGTDQNLIPFNSDASLHRWKMDSYFSSNDETAEAPYDVASPQGSQLGLSDGQSQPLSPRARDIKSRLEEIRLKRLSLQEHNYRQSQESLRQMFSTLERSRMRSLERVLDKSQSMEYFGRAQDHYENTEYFYPRLKPPEETGESEEPVLPDAQRSGCYYDRQTTYKRQEALSRMLPAASKPDGRPPGLGLRTHAGNTQSPSRAMDTLLDIPEERHYPTRVKNPSTGNKATGCSAAMEEGRTPVGSLISNRPVGTHRQGQATAGRRSTGKGPSPAAAGTPAGPQEGSKTTLNREATVSASPSTVNSSTSNVSAVRAAGSVEKLQRKNSIRAKFYSLLTLEDRKAAKKEDKSLQKKPSGRSQTLAGSSREGPTESSGGQQTMAVELSFGKKSNAAKEPSNGGSRSHDANDGLAEKDRRAFPPAFERLSLGRSSKTKTSAVARQDAGGRPALASDRSTTPRAKKKVYSRFEYVVQQDMNLPDTPVSAASSLMNGARQPSTGSSKNYSTENTLTAQDNKLGRFMQRMGHLMAKNK